LADPPPQLKRQPFGATTLMTLIRTLFMLAAVLASPSIASAQAPRYVPARANPHGPELVMVYISSSTCIGNRARGLHEAIDSLKLILQARATARGMTFRAVGVALDWSADTGLSYLKEFGTFDEYAVGSNWFGLGPATLIWGDSTAAPHIPQVLIYEQSVAIGDRVGFGPRTTRARRYGGDTLVAWIRGGAVEP
jgi:hypothetical protein